MPHTPVLAIQTSLAPHALALLPPAGAPPILRRLQERRLVEDIIPFIGDLMEQAALNFNALKRIAATTGPGPFLALRAGLAAARALALAANTPLFAAPASRLLDPENKDGEAAALRLALLASQSPPSPPRALAPLYASNGL